MITLSTNQLAVLLACIFQTEGGTNTSYPYGIMQGNPPIKHLNLDKARALAQATVLHAAKDYVKVGKGRASSAASPSPRVAINQRGQLASREAGVRGRRPERKADDNIARFVDFLSLRYCPPSCDPVGNRNWRKNMILLAKQKGLVL